MKITIIGTGYVGLVTGTCLAEVGNSVVCVDIDKDKVLRMKEGILPIYEPHLKSLFDRNIKEERLLFTTSLDEGLTHGDIIFLALPTPEDKNGSVDLSYVLEVANQIGQKIDKYKVIVNKSTVPIGTAKLVTETIKKHTNTDFDVVSNPEFLREGFAVSAFMKPDRIVIGSSSEKAINLMKKIYNPFVRKGNPILIMDEYSSELTKYAANAFLATKITFMNEIANFCEKTGANVDMVRIGIGSDPRIGKHFLFPGIGYGGSCFPKDVKALYKSGLDYDFEFKILDAVDKINQKQKTALIPKILNHFDNNLKGKTFAMWGLSFKPETDDIREAPSLYIIEKLLELGASITAFDPEAMQNVKRKLGDKISFSDKAIDATIDADALIISTEWNTFRTPDFKQLSKNLNEPIIFDGRNLYDLEKMKKRNFIYYSIGRKTITN